MKLNTLKSIGFLLNLSSYISPQLAAKMAIKLFSSPQKGKLKDIDGPFLKSATHEKLFYKNSSIMTYHWEGNKETVLLVHGWESNAARWEKLIYLLKSLDYNIIALDAPAHGKSGSKVFNAILYSEFINVVAKKFHADIVIGHSVGGMASIFFQHKYQLPSLKKIVLLGAPSNFVGVFDRYSKMMGYNKRIIEAMNQEVLKKFKYLPEYFSTAKFSKEIKSKGLVIHDKKDRIIPFSDALDYAKYYSNAILVKTKGYGHRLKSDEVHNHIIEFLNS
ncbi:MAG: alpha/beta hydrolase [Flaviramulus sp.]|nr:alpha/beta hydrolase [Flaviramulus sp.]